MAKPKSSSKKQSSSTHEVVGSQKAYDDFLPAAQAIDASDVRPFRADASLAYHNVERGLDAVAGHIDRIKSELPKVSVSKLQQLSDIALAVMFASAQVDRGSDGATPGLLKRARELRDPLIKSADALAASGVIPARAVEKIHAGRGSIDLAQDCVDLAALFTKHAKEVKGKTAVNAAQIKEAAAVGTDLLKRLKRRGTKTKAQPGVTDAIDARDRLWTLLVLRHGELRRVGMWIWADDVDAHVPPLQSRAVASKKPKADATKGAGNGKSGGEAAMGDRVGNG
ncbi:hypothetical protein A7982_13424 [Minicystis rosea]|nr:hypothetical protein A7982_13424 [Minicystis rosea]